MENTITQSRLKTEPIRKLLFQWLGADKAADWLRQNKDAIAAHRAGNPEPFTAAVLAIDGLTKSQRKELEKLL